MSFNIRQIYNNNFTPLKTLISKNTAFAVKNDIKLSQLGTVLRFTGKNHHAIMVMLKNAPTTTYPFHLRDICTPQMLFLQTGSLPTRCPFVCLKPTFPKRLSAFLY